MNNSRLHETGEDPHSPVNAAKRKTKMKTDQQKLDAAEPIGVAAAIAHLTERNAPTPTYAELREKCLQDQSAFAQEVISEHPNGFRARAFEDSAKRLQRDLIAARTPRAYKVETGPMNLCFVNGWSETPQIVKDCEAAGHKRTGTHDGTRCLSTTTCYICEYTFSMDSGD